MTEHRITFRWRSSLFGSSSVTVIHDGTHAEAFAALREIAEMSGWRPARWWEFWRSGDTLLAQQPGIGGDA